MKPVIAFLLTILTAGCAAPAGILPMARDPMKVDYLGNHYPAACADLSDINIPIIESDHVTYAPGEMAWGEWLERRPTNVILILRGLEPWKRAETLRHERCHEMMWRMTGDPRWHPGAHQ